MTRSEKASLLYELLPSTNQEGKQIFFPVKGDESQVKAWLHIYGTLRGSWAVEYVGGASLCNLRKTRNIFVLIDFFDKHVKDWQASSRTVVPVSYPLPNYNEYEKFCEV